MTLKERYSGIIGWFKEHQPVVQSELSFTSPYELIVAVALSAQCTDKRVNMVTPDLFRRFPTVQSLAQASFDEVFELIRSVSYPRNKTEHLIKMAGQIVGDFGGEVPSTVDELMTLSGVGRKTANVVTSIIYDNPVIAVDTHVFRVAHRLGLSRGKTPTAVEMDLERHIAVEDIPRAHHWLLLHGRYVCTARSPHCSECGLQPWCLQSKQ